VKLPPAVIGAVWQQHAVQEAGGAGALPIG
jgi:hypothetical protein